MALTSRGHFILELTNGRPLCPRCRAPIWGLRVQHEKLAYEKLTFQCPRCEHSHMNVAFPETQTSIGPIVRIAKNR